MIRISVAYTIPVFHADGKFKHFIVSGTHHYAIHLVKAICEGHIVCFDPPQIG